MTEPYDPTAQALVSASLAALNPDANVTTSYLDQLRQALVELHHILIGTDTAVLNAEDEAVLRQTLSYFDAHAGDAELGVLDVVRRLLVALEREVFRWDSAPVQRPGWSGDIQIALADGYGEGATPPYTDVEVLGREPAA